MGEYGRFVHLKMRVRPTHCCDRPAETVIGIAALGNCPIELDAYAQLSVGILLPES